MHISTIIPIASTLFFAYLCGNLSKRKALSKGYEDTKYFWIGFIFNLPGLLYIALLPVRLK